MSAPAGHLMTASAEDPLHHHRNGGRGRQQEREYTDYGPNSVPSQSSQQKMQREQQRNQQRDQQRDQQRNQQQDQQQDQQQKRDYSADRAIGAPRALSRTGSRDESNPGNEQPMADEAVTRNYLTREECKPVNNPSAELRRVLHHLESEQWDECFDALTSIRCLALHHSSVLNLQMSAVMRGIMKATNNLRSSVAKNALLALNDVVVVMGKELDAELDNIIPKLLKKASESSSGFIGDEADRCLMTMCTSCTQARVLSTLMSASSNRVPVVRAKAACHIGYCVSKLGSDVCTLRELNRLVNVGVKFMGEPVQDARHAGRRLLYSLYTHGAVELRQLQRLLQEREYRQLLELVQRGGPPPTDNVDFLVTNSSRRGRATPARRSRSRSRSLSRQSSTVSENEDGSAGSGRDSRGSNGGGNSNGGGSNSNGGGNGGGRARDNNKRRGSSRQNANNDKTSYTSADAAYTLPAQFEVLPKLYKQMGSNDWRERQEALRITVNLVVKNSKHLTRTQDVLSVFDHLTPRLTDNNSKVNLSAVRAMHELIPAVRSHLSSVLPSFVSALASNLASTDKKVHAAASEAFNILMANVEPTTAFQPVIAIAASSSPRIKAALFDRICDMLASVSASKPRLLVRYALPTALRAMDTRSSNGDLRLATQRLIKQLYRVMGDDMIRAVRTAQVSSAIKESVLTLVSK